MDSISKEPKTVFLVYAYSREELQNTIYAIEKFFDSLKDKEKYIVIDAKRKIRSSEYLLTSIFEEIKNCDLSVVILDELRANLAFELGLLHSLEKNYILLVDKAKLREIKRDFSDIDGLKIVTYDPKNLSELENLLESELEHIKNKEIEETKKKLTPQYLLSLGDALFQVGHYDEALTKYSAAVESKSNFYEGYVGLGDTYYAMYKLKEAEKFYKKAIDIRKNKIWIYEKLAKVLLDSGKYQEAIEWYQKLIAIMPNNDNYFFGIAVALNELKDISKAIEFFDKEINKNPNKANLYYDKSWTCVRQSEREVSPSNKDLWIEKSLETLKKAIDIDSAYKIRAKEDRDFDPICNNKNFQKLISD